MFLYPQDYWSTSTIKPSKDSANNFVLISATEAAGYTTVVFERYPETSDTFNDVQFKVKSKRRSTGWEEGGATLTLCLV